MSIYVTGDVRSFSESPQTKIFICLLSLHFSCYFLQLKCGRMNDYGKFLYATILSLEAKFLSLFSRRQQCVVGRLVMWNINLTSHQATCGTHLRNGVLMGLEFLWCQMEVMVLFSIMCLTYLVSNYMVKQQGPLLSRGIRTTCVNMCVKFCNLLALKRTVGVQLSYTLFTCLVQCFYCHSTDLSFS